MADIKDALKDIRAGRFEAISIERHRKALESKRLIGEQSLEPHGKHPQADRLSELTAEIDEVDKKLQKHTKNLLTQEKKLLDIINRIERSDYRQILYLRYLEDTPLSWMQIADIMDYSESDIKRKHGKALAEARKLWGKGG